MNIFGDYNGTPISLNDLDYSSFVFFVMIIGGREKNFLSICDFPSRRDQLFLKASEQIKAYQGLKDLIF